MKRGKIKVSKIGVAQESFPQAPADFSFNNSSGSNRELQCGISSVSRSEQLSLSTELDECYLRHQDRESDNLL